MNKRWQIKEKYDNKFKDKFPEIDPVVLQLLYNRGLDDQDKIDRFLGPDYIQDQHDAYLFKDIKKAVERIFKAIKDKEKIVIFGDYDADGVSSTALLYLTLKKLGAENLGVYIPNRLHEGYGMNLEAVEELAKNKTNLIITVDCGITNLAEVKLAQDKNIDVIVVDHHIAGDELPLAYCIICPTVKDEKYPFNKLAGVGVAFKLAQALLKHPPVSALVKGEGNQYEAFEKWLLDLVAIGTVADCVPLLGENRTLVKWGLLVLNKTQRLGLQELINSISVNQELVAYNIAFQIGPRLNAAGRMEHANTAYELLITQDQVEAIAITNELNQKNQARQKATDEMMKISLEQIGEPCEEDKILFSTYDGWSPGLVGLAAGKLADMFHRPVIVFGKMGDKYVASGRSIPEFDITHSLNKCSQYLEEFGGHEQACGLTIMGEENYNKFKEKVLSIAQEKLKDVELVPRLDIEAEIKLKQADWDLIDELEKFAPFGEANPEPLFLTKDLRIYDIVTMGVNNQHLRLSLEDVDDNIPRKFVGFNLTEEWLDKIKSGDMIDVVYELGVNEWNNNREVQLKIVDLKLCE